MRPFIQKLPWAGEVAFCNARGLCGTAFFQLVPSALRSKEPPANACQNCQESASGLLVITRIHALKIRLCWQTDCDQSSKGHHAQQKYRKNTFQKIHLFTSQELFTSLKKTKTVSNRLSFAVFSREL